MKASLKVFSTSFFGLGSLLLFTIYASQTFNPIEYKIIDIGLLILSLVAIGTSSLSLAILQVNSTAYTRQGDAHFKMLQLFTIYLGIVLLIVLWFFAYVYPLDLVVMSKFGYTLPSKLILPFRLFYLIPIFSLNMYVGTGFLQSEGRYSELVKLYLFGFVLATIVMTICYLIPALSYYSIIGLISFYFYIAMNIIYKTKLKQLFSILFFFNRPTSKNN